MQPPSFDEFIRAKRLGGDGEGIAEPFTLEVCPTPGCKCNKLWPAYENGLIAGFKCDAGCEFTAKRNAFTGDLLYYGLVEFVESRFDDPEGIRGMKFNALGEHYTDWY